MRKQLLSERVWTITGSFAFIEHCFLRHGFWSSLSYHELLLYFFLILFGDRQEVSFYCYDKICSILGVDVDQ